MLNNNFNAVNEYIKNIFKNFDFETPYFLLPYTTPISLKMYFFFSIKKHNLIKYSP